MSKYQFTPEALSDLFELWSYIAEDSVEAATRVEEAVFAACELAAARPLGGQAREDLTALP
jgi:plasmid stabilization system protein ParE